MADNNTRVAKPIRLWPGVVVAVLILLIKLTALVMPDGMIIGLAGGLIGALAIAMWWLFFSRVPWLERVGAIVFAIVALFVTSRIVHQSISNGMMGMMLPIYAIPVLCVALV